MDAIQHERAYFAPVRCQEAALPDSQPPDTPTDTALAAAWPQLAEMLEELAPAHDVQSVASVAFGMGFALGAGEGAAEALRRFEARQDKERRDGV